MQGHSAPPAGLRSLPIAWGAALTADPTTDLGQCLWNTGIYDLPISEVLARLIQPGDTVIDAGANVGYMTLLMAVLSGSEGRVLAFEPHPYLFERLESNLRDARARLRIAPTELHNVALGDEPGTADLVVPREFSRNQGLARIQADSSASASTSEDSRIPVPIETLDQVLGSDSAVVMKLDVEGFEPQVLRGSARALADRRIRHVVFEDHVGPGSETMRILQDLGMEILALGWNVGGLRIAPLGSGSQAKDYEAPNYLATFAPSEVRERCSRGGWRTLSPHLTDRCREPAGTP